MLCELGGVPAAGAEIQRKQSIFQGNSPFPLVESTPERSKAGRTYAYAQVACLAARCALVESVETHVHSQPRTAQ